MALFVQLDVNYPEHHKIIEAGLDGAGLHAMSLCIAKRMEADGWIPRGVLRRLGASDDLIDRLVDLRLFEVGDDGRVRPWGWLDRNPSQGAIDAIRATKAEAAKAGNHRRWGHEGPVDKCPKCYPNVQVVAGCDRIGSQAEKSAKRVRSPETETETETTTSSKSQDYSQPDPSQSAAAPPEVETVVDEQAVRRTAALVGRTQADRANPDNPGAYAAGITRSILTGDPLDRARIERLLAEGRTPEQIADGWAGPDPLNPDRPVIDPGPDLRALYEANAERTRTQLAGQHRDPPEMTADARAAARAALRAVPS